jgi:hypothetical protein
MKPKMIKIPKGSTIEKEAFQMIDGNTVYYKGSMQWYLREIHRLWWDDKNSVLNTGILKELKKDT